MQVWVRCWHRRPAWKTRYPLIPLQRYVNWRQCRSGVFDAWLRLHRSFRACQLAIAESSMTVTGTVAEWESWTGMAFPGSGDQFIPGGPEPLNVDVDADCGTYRGAKRLGPS